MTRSWPAIARSLAAHGATVALAARREDRLTALAAEIRAADGSSVAGRQAIGGAAVYSLTEFGVTAFGEALRQELAALHVRVSSVEPGAVATELTDHIRAGVREQNQAWYASMETLQPQDVADTVSYIVTRPRHVAINELLIRPTEQA